MDIQRQENAGHAANGYYILRSVNQARHAVRLIAAHFLDGDRRILLVRHQPDAGRLLRVSHRRLQYFGQQRLRGRERDDDHLAAHKSCRDDFGNNIDLSWTAPYDFGATTYNIYRSTTSGGESGDMIASGVTGTTYADTTALGGVA